MGRPTFDDRPLLRATHHPSGERVTMQIVDFDAFIFSMPTTEVFVTDSSGNQRPCRKDELHDFAVWVKS